MRTLAILLFCLAFAGCASNAAKFIERDPNERLVAGTIIDKVTQASTITNEKNGDSIIKNILEVTLEGIGEIIARITIVGGIATVIVLDAMNQDQTDSPPLIYTVRSTENKLYIVLSNYPGFSIGECVNLFISSDLERYPPRMTHNSLC